MNATMRLAAMLLLVSSCGDPGHANPGEPGAITLTIAVAPTKVHVGDSATISWSATNADACSATGAWQGNRPPSGSSRVGSTSGGVFVYRLQCTNAAHSSRDSAIMIVPLSVLPTSYENAKRDIDPIGLPFCKGGVNARAYADFLQEGRISLFIQGADYDGAPGRSCFFRRTAAGWQDVTSSVLADVSGCVHPRKAVVADFNRDSVPDVLVACTGYDQPPYPGESSMLLLSSAGRFRKVALKIDSAYTHGASAGDVNSDGYPDILFMDRQKLYFLINKAGDGTFNVDTTRMPNAAFIDHGVFSMELVDVDADGHLDAIVGGYEGSQADSYPATILWGDAAGGFTSRGGVSTPALSECVALDFTVRGNALYKLAACEGYTRTTVQRVSLAGMTASLVYDHAGGYPEAGVGAIDWLYVSGNQLISDWPLRAITIPPN